ncbi:MAG TPA: hypothetical protein PKI14_01310 [Fervidobacterium sp.]|nr:hypothetical protein [Fervidobacterium sp.]
MVEMTSLECMKKVWKFDGSRGHASRIVNEYLFDVLHYKTRENLYETLENEVHRALKLVGR